MKGVKSLSRVPFDNEIYQTKSDIYPQFVSQELLFFLSNKQEKIERT